MLIYIILAMSLYKYILILKEKGNPVERLVRKVMGLRLKAKIARLPKQNFLFNSISHACREIFYFREE